MPHLDSVLACLDLNLDRSVERLSDLMRIPSISTDPAYAGDCRRAADWLAGESARRLGFDASVARHAGPSDGRRATAAPAARRTSCSTAITTCSRSIRWTLWDADPFDPDR